MSNEVFVSWKEHVYTTSWFDFQYILKLQIHKFNYSFWIQPTVVIKTSISDNFLVREKRYAQWYQKVNGNMEKNRQRNAVSYEWLVFKSLPKILLKPVFGVFYVTTTTAEMR